MSDPVTGPGARIVAGAAVDVDPLSLGAVHEGERRGAGSLWIQGGQLTVAGEVTVGAGGDAELRVSDGALSAARVTQSSDGVLTFGLSSDRGTPIEASAEVSLAGTVRVTLDPGEDWGESGERILIQAASLTTEGMSAEVPEGFELRTETEGDGVQLLLAWGESTGDDDDATAGDDDDDATGDDDTGLEPGEGGCECACGPERSTVGTAAPIPVIGVLLRRRRR